MSTCQRNYVYLFEYVDLSDIILTSKWQLGAFTCYKTIYKPTRCDDFFRHND